MFEDLHASMWHHATWRTLLENDDPWKFSLKMPKETACLYTCLFDLTLSYEVGVPCSWHILQDSKSFISDCKAIRDARGVVVPGLGSRKGCRQGNVVSIVNANHSGARGKKDSPEKTWVHPVVIEGFALFIQQIMKKIECADKNELEVSDEDEADEKDITEDEKEDDELLDDISFFEVMLGNFI